ncbi:MAG: hypothetical protein H0U22_13505 [Geodermatophilaceae bacterium]|nr:hypothetical protein [Geodermatophilaceae bacterium]
MLLLKRVAAVASGWRLVGDASRYRAQAGNAAPTELHSTFQGPGPW